MDLVVGLPAVPVRHLERPHALAAWTSTPIEPQAAPGSGGGQQGALGDAGEDVEPEPEDEREIAARDPLAGLIQMQVKVFTMLGCIPLQGFFVL